MCNFILAPLFYSHIHKKPDISLWIEKSKDFFRYTKSQNYLHYINWYDSMFSLLKLGKIHEDWMEMGLDFKKNLMGNCMELRYKEINEGLRIKAWKACAGLRTSFFGQWCGRNSYGSFIFREIMVECDLKSVWLAIITFYLTSNTQNWVM